MRFFGLRAPLRAQWKTSEISRKTEPTTGLASNRFVNISEYQQALFTSGGLPKRAPELNDCPMVNYEFAKIGSTIL
jgi:hypothetical protein